MAFAALTSPHAVIVLLLGFAGSLGNTVFTGLFLSVTTGLVWFLTVRYDVVLSALDYIFAAFVAVVICSTLSKGVTAEPKEYALLILTLSAYPACRFIRASDLTRGRDTFVGVQVVLVLIGTAVTFPTVVEQLHAYRAKPIVLGFDAAPIYFLQALCYVIFAVLMMRQLTAFRALVFSVLMFVPLATFAAAYVRFMFVALVGALIVAACSSNAWRRKSILIVIAAIVLSVAAGLSFRSENIKRFATYAIGGDQTDPASALPPKPVPPAGPQVDSGGAPAQQPDQPVQPKNRAPSCTTDTNVNLQNSIAIRRVLLLDAKFMLPSAGLLGHGLDAFMKVTCMTGHEMHNSPLQAFVEFGWLGGALFSALIVTGLWSIVRSAKRDAASRFVLCCLTFAVLLCLAHGRLSREAALFAWIGTVAGITQSARTRPPAALPAKLFVSS